MAAQGRIGICLMVVVLGAAAPGAAQPADCSEGPIPEQPLVLRTPGLPDRSLPVVVVAIEGRLTMTSDGRETVYEMRGLTMKDRTGWATTEASITVLAASGQLLDGRTFRQLPVKQSDTQEKVAGQVVFQGWSIKGQDMPVAGQYLDASHVSYVASARVEFGTHNGKQLPGKIRLCVPGGQKGMFDSVLKDPLEVVGSFTATLR